MNTTSSISASDSFVKANKFDFNLEETDWTLDQVDENLVKLNRVKEICTHESRFDTILHSNYTESISEFGDSCISPINPFDHREMMPSQKDISHLKDENIKLLTPIPECPSIEEFSASEDSCNCSSILDGNSRTFSVHRANKVMEKNVKTLCDVHLKFRNN